MPGRVLSGEADEGTEEVGEAQHRQAVGLAEIETDRAGVHAHHRHMHVAGKGHEDRRRQQQPRPHGEPAARGVGEATAGGVARAAQDEPDHHHRPFDVGDLGKAGVGGEGDAERQGDPAAYIGGAAAVDAFDSEEHQRKERHRVGAGASVPGERAVEREQQAPDRCHRRPETQLPQEQPRPQPGSALEQQVEEELSLRQCQEQGRRVEGARLHSGGQRRAESLEGVPPGDHEVQPVERRPMTERLRGVADVGVDRPLAGEEAGLCHRARTAERDERVDVDDPEDRENVGGEDPEHDERRPGCPSQHG